MPTSKSALQEFKAALPKLEAWGMPAPADPDAAFSSLDTDGGGLVLFNEFASYAIKQKLDLEDDNDDEVQSFASTDGVAADAHF